MKVSILILTYNEAANLPACLDALTWCDDILVVDSGSTDGTPDIALRRGARVLTRPFDNFAGQRNFGLDAGDFRHDWVLHLDADEIVTEAFRDALLALPETEALDAWRVPFKTMFFGQWLRRAGMWPAYQVRLGHARRLRFVQVGHGQREDLPPERIGEFRQALLHYSFSHGLRRWLDKHVRYAADEAAVIAAEPRRPGALRDMLFGRDGTTRRRGAKALASGLPLFARPPARFFYIYVLRRGFLDGGPGFVYAVMLSVYEAMIALLVYESRRGANRNRVPDGSSDASPGSHTEGAGGR